MIELASFRDVLEVAVSASLTEPAGLGHEPAITVVYTEYEAEEGGKSLFGTAQRVVTKVGQLDVGDLASNLSAFCRQIGQVFEAVSTPARDYELQRFELVLEVTAKGEVRFVGSAGSELKGGLKLVFTRRDQHPDVD
jgi:hypothetical protein